MTILGLFLIFTVIGLCAWLLTTFVPMPSQIKTLIVVAAVVFCVLILLQAVGLLPTGLGTVPRIR